MTGLSQGCTLRSITTELGRHVSTVSREVFLNLDDHEAYSAFIPRACIGLSQRPSYRKQNCRQRATVYLYTQASKKALGAAADQQRAEEALPV